MQDPTNHREADWTDSIVCLNAAARLAKRLILAQQRENRLRIEGIGAETHHASFADPAIVRKVAELFAQGKKVLLLTNDASVAIRSLGICDDLQRHNNISDEDWDEHYAPLRPMVFTFEDLRLLDYYTRQYHYIQMAAGSVWMADIPRKVMRNVFPPMQLWKEAFRPGDKRKGDNLFTEQEMKIQQEKQKQQEKEKQRQQQQEKQKQQQEKQKQQQQEKQRQQAEQQRQQAELQRQQAEQQRQQQAEQQRQQAEQQKQQAEQVAAEVSEASKAKENKAAVQDVKVETKDAEKAETPKTEKKPRPKSRRKPQKKQPSAPAAEQTTKNE